jgi:purine-binding chemotaxis protein CheW
VTEPGFTAVPASGYLTFSIAGVDCAIGIEKVREIMKRQEKLEAPDAPDWISGFVMLRDRVVPVVDLAAKFGLSDQSRERRSCVVVVDLKPASRIAALGIAARGVQRVVDLPNDDVALAPPFGTQVRLDFLRGMGRIGRNIVLVLDVDGLLTNDEMLNAAAVVDTIEAGKDGSSSAS